MAHLLVLFLALVQIALATLRDQFPTPYDAQIGALRFPISCNADGLSLTIDGFYTGTAPIYAAPGQPTYITDVTAAITIPSYLTTVGGFVGIDHANTKVNINIDASNTSPASSSPFPDGLWINDTKIVFGKAATIQVPATGVLPPVGPFAGIDAGRDASFFLGNVTAQVHLYTKTNQQVLVLDVKCPAVKHPISLGSFNVQGSPNKTTFAPANGFRPKYPSLKNLQEIGYFHVPYICDLGLFKDIVFDLFFGGVLFGSAPASSQLSFTNITATLQVPQSLLDVAHKSYGAQTFESSVTDVQLGLTNASPASYNLVKSPIVATNTYPTEGGFPINIPTKGSLTAGPFTAGKSVGDYMVLSIGNATAMLAFKNSKGATTGSFAATCHPQGKLNLYG